ncbi:hypothetical protein DPMN_040473 [Dreissena polymorpha]|uniref:Uncharacterized protein n=1 Tax=Dreissena polymorpha TaxID=45954 RepID=A0A9D4HV85_DREPO|nr:hypothetical protein DPMN_040473 [Dreissena polymorpha]
MSRAFSSTASELCSCFSSSQASQNRMFSSLYSERRNSLNTFRPAANETCVYKSNDLSIKPRSENTGINTCA